LKQLPLGGEILSLSSIETLLQPAAHIADKGADKGADGGGKSLFHPSEESVLQNLDGRRDWRDTGDDKPIENMLGGRGNAISDRHIEHSARDHVSKVLEDAQLYYSSRSRGARARSPAGDRRADSTPSAGSRAVSPLRSLTGTKKGGTVSSVAFSGRDHRF
jgi:hypothetical protein